MEVCTPPVASPHLKATGDDAAARRQYLYHPEWRSAADAAKFARLGQLCLPLGRLRRRVDADLRGGSEDRSCAVLVRLIDDSLIRPGSLRHFRSTGSVGATTRQAEHLDVTRHVVHLQFEGKSAIDHDIEVHDPLLARTLSKMLDAAEPGQPLFTDDSGAAVDTAKVNDYIRTHAGTNFTAKDLRTWGATCLVAQRLVKVKALDLTATDEGAVEAAVRLAIDDAAERLGNTAAVCRASYVSPSVIEGFADGTLLEAWRSTRSSRWLSRSERTVGRILDGPG
jgi:DNA topoisomerase-1